MYQRVIPRDLFNECKLLKCLGQLAVLIHDGIRMPPNLRSEADGSEFRIDQNPGCGGLYVSDGIKFVVLGVELSLKTPYNSKESYPLLCETEDDEVQVFDDNGQLTDEFRNYVARIGDKVTYQFHVGER